MSRIFAISRIGLGVAIALCSTATLAQEQTKQPNKPATKKIEQIVVSGTPGGIGVSKKEAGFAVTNIDASNIEILSPKSTADLFKAVPGVWVESSGGESGANVFVRGFPATGDAPYLTLSLEGTPVYPAPTLSFLENSTLFRIDETISTMEALRGGPNPVVSNGQPGLTTNFRLKRGGVDTEGLIKYTTSDYNLQRADVVLSGELANDFYYMVGGYIKRSPGIRDAGFTSEEGHQFTINLTKQWQNGELNLYTRQTDDHGTWYLPTPLNVDGIDAEYTQIGSFNRQATITFGPDNQQQTFDFAQGRGWDGHVSGGSIKLEFDNGWHLAERFSLTKGKANTFGLVPNDAATTVAEVADNGESATGLVTGQVYAADTPVQQIGRWVVLKDINAFVNDLAVSKSWDKLNASFGFYTATTKANDWWSLGNQAYHVLQSGGEMLEGIECNSSAEGCGWNYDINGTGDATTRAFYTALSYDINEQLTADIGLRRENHQVEYTVDEGLTGQISKAVSYDKSKTSWTAGINYNLSDTTGLFGRVNKGYKMPYFDDFRDNFQAYDENNDDLIKAVSQMEFGYKYMTPEFQAFATVFANEVEGESFVAVPGTPAEIFTTEAKGIELDFNYRADSGLAVNLNATWQDTEITNSPINEGKDVQRQPPWQLRLTPSYAMELGGDQYLTFYGTVSAVDDRYGNNENTVVLPSYEKIDLGVIYEPMDRVKLQLSVDNLTDELGLTEGDPRNALAPNGRYILPRSVKLSLSYQFY